MPATDYQPSVEAVAGRLRMRTMTRSGRYLDTFADPSDPYDPEDDTGGIDGTQPTHTQATAVIGQALNEMVAWIGADVPEPARESARALTALYAAMLIELTYFPEQVTTNRSPYQQLKELFDMQLPNLQKRINALRAQEGDDGDGFGESSVMPVSYYPRDLGGLVGWDTQF